MSNFDYYRYHRRSIRLQGYDYGGYGAYFITICVQKRAQLFGSIEGSTILPTPAGITVEHVLQQLPQRFPTLSLDASIIMPNHIHAILVLSDKSPLVGDKVCSKNDLGSIVQAFKSLTTRLYGEGVTSAGWPPYEQRLWQRNYYERIIRDETELNAIRCYVHDNPMNWYHDPENPRFAQSPTL